MILLISIIWVHFFADFILQTDKQATRKSTSNYWLLQHIVIYSLVLLVLYGYKYALVNSLLHFITDWISSRLTSMLYNQGKRHQFFVVIGADQAIHLTCLILTMGLI